MAMYSDAGYGGKLGGLRQVHSVPEGEMDALLLGKTRELVAATPSQKNWAGIVISLLVICGVCGLILLSIYLLRPPDDGPRVKGRKVYLNDTTSGRFIVPPFNGSWISETELIFRDHFGGLSILNADTLVSRAFVPSTTFRQLYAHQFSVSSDRKFILFTHDTRPVWKYSTLGKYTIYDIEHEEMIPLNPQQDTNRQSHSEQSEFQHVEWGTVGNSLVFVYRNDIYYKTDVRSSRIHQITKTGTEGIIFNGIPDWIYEVEVLKTNKALWMNPKGTILLYAVFNDSGVGEVSYPWFGDNLQYPKLRTLRYPKAGTENPTVTLWLVELSGLRAFQSKILIPPKEVDSKNHYITGVRWVSDSIVSIVWMNRAQSITWISSCTIESKLNNSWECQSLYTISVKPVDSGWLDFSEPPVFSSNYSSILVKVPWRDGAAGHFQHIVWVNLETFKEVALTQGAFEVTEISAWDEANGYIYFIAVPHKYPGERHLYRLREKTSNTSSAQPPVCLTCPTNATRLRRSRSPTIYYTTNKSSTNSYSNPNPSNDYLPLENELEEIMLGDGPILSSFGTGDISSSSSNAYLYQNSSPSILPDKNATKPSDPLPLILPDCLFNRVTFSPSNRFYVRECLGPGVPTVTLHGTPFGKFLTLLNNHTELKDEVSGIGFPIVTTFEVPLTGGYNAPVRLYLPPGWRKDEEFKFPFILHVAGGPGTQIISEKWHVSWPSYLTSQKNYIVAEVDARGTGYQGEQIRHTVYQKLGTVGVNDQLEVVKYLRDLLSYIDTDNMAVYGHGYGGYIALLVLASDAAKMFRCAIAVSPITKWEYYNTAYTERYMGVLQPSNYLVYEESDVTRFLSNLSDRQFLIIHGTADETVHYQHTLYLTKALIKNGVPFTEQIYPDENHELTGVVEHLYSTMEAFLERIFDPFDWEDWEKANFLGIKM